MIKHKLQSTQSCKEKIVETEGTVKKIFCKFHPEAVMLDYNDAKKCSECDLIVTNSVMDENKNFEIEEEWRSSCSRINCACHQIL